MLTRPERRRVAGVEFPVNVALARAVSTLPHGPDYWYEPKFDGHRMIIRRTEESVILYARSGRVVTSNWMDLAVAGMELRPATVLDGEAVVWRDGHLDFGAVQSRAASSVARARFLAGQHPAAYACWDVLHHPDPAIGDTRALPYTRRRELLLNLLDGIGSPIQPVPATDDRTVAEGTGTSRCSRWGSKVLWPSAAQLDTPRAVGPG